LFHDAIAIHRLLKDTIDASDFSSALSHAMYLDVIGMAITAV
jgi:hypothetical protein